MCSQEQTEGKGGTGTKAHVLPRISAPSPHPAPTPPVRCAPSYPWNHQSGRSSLRERLSSGAVAQNSWEKGQKRGAEATSGIRGLLTEVEASRMAHEQS